MASAHLTLQSGNALVRIPLESILYLESRRHYLMVYARCGTFRMRGKISEYAERLREAGFVQIHRRYVVNDAWVRRRATGAVVLATGEELPVGRRYRG